MSDESDASTRSVQALAAACESRDWPWGVSILLELPYRLRVREIVTHPAHTREIAFGAIEGPWTFVSELWSSLDETSDSPGRVDVSTLPSRIADWFFAETSMALRRAEDEGNWVLFCDYFETLLELPAASELREQQLLATIARVGEHARTAQAELLAGCRQQHQPIHQPGLERFHALIAILGNAAQSPAYQDIPRLVLPGVLADAGWPILSCFDAETIALLTPELGELRRRSSEIRITPQAREWLRRHFSPSAGN